MPPPATAAIPSAASAIGRPILALGLMESDLADLAFTEIPSHTLIRSSRVSAPQAGIAVTSGATNLLQPLKRITRGPSDPLISRAERDSDSSARGRPFRRDRRPVRGS